MAGTETPDLPGPAADLLAEIVGQNVKNLAHTTDLIIEGLEEQALAFAQTIVDLDSVLASATVIDRATENRLRTMEPAIWSAADYLDRKMTRT